MIGMSAVKRTRAGLLALFVALGAGGAHADCGEPPASDAELLAAPAAAEAIRLARESFVNPEGRLWKVETTPPSYLVGTFHIAAGGIERPGPVLEEIVDGAELLFVEVDQAALQAAVAAWASDPAQLFRKGDSRLSTSMTEAEIARASGVLENYGIPFGVADQMKPFILFGLLSLPPCAMESAKEAGLDAVLEARAAAAGVEVRPLETVDEQLEVFNPENPADLDAILRIMFVQAEALEEQWFLTLAFYRQGKIAALLLYGVAGFEELVGADEAERIATMFWERLISSRNRRMAERMLPELREGGVVVAVGALHLTGDDGLVALLREEGFTVTPVAEGDPAAAQ